MLFQQPLENISPLREKLDEVYRQEETACVQNLLDNIHLNAQQQKEIETLATQFIHEMRRRSQHAGGIDKLMQRYDLSSEQGIALMCLAEALLRVPDADTIDDLIKDKLFSADWETELNKGDSLFVNATTWGLVIAGKIYKPNKQHKFVEILRHWLQQASEPIVRNAVKEAVKVLSKQFVLGETIEQALKRAEKGHKKGYLYSFDMLGEAARTEADAQFYLQAYKNAIEAVGNTAKSESIHLAHGISVKLSALHPRYEVAQQETMLPIVIERLTELALLAKKYNIGLTVDAEEADRLDLSLVIMEAVFSHPALDHWQGFGLALQAYQKRAFYVIDWAAALAKSQNRKIMLRLVKGAYWDYEIKDSQLKGLNDYPVFTRKINTDVSYLACAQKMIANRQWLYPQFATHNAQTVAAIITMTAGATDFEFQRLKGMGRTLYDQITGEAQFNVPCRVYAPVGNHRDLLAYLVRRLLENGANSSFVNRIAHNRTPINELVADPIHQVKTLQAIPNPNIPLPKNLYGNARCNSQGLDLSSPQVLTQLAMQMEEFKDTTWHLAKPQNPKKIITVANPTTQQTIGEVHEPTAEEIEAGVVKACRIAEQWNWTPINARAQCLENAADLLENHRAEFMTMIMREGGRTIPDALSEVREAVDFCRYYAACAREYLTTKTLPGPTGESNTLQMHGRGVTLCISPWNFPLAIFTGQIMAALVAGNPVIAKPANQTPLVAHRAVELFYQAGIPKAALQLMPGAGKTVGAKLVADLRIRCVMLTGSTETARSINQALANREGPIVPLIAETGGQNALIADSTALPEQLVVDVIASAFGSAGQRCSALRVLYVQDVVAERMITMLKGAMAELTIGDPRFIATDVGPVIDSDAKEMLQAHITYLDSFAKLIHRVPLPEDHQQGTFFAPCAYEIDTIKHLPREVFGPILHVIRYKHNQLDQVIDEINNTGYGLTAGIHSRITSAADYIQQRLHVGNVYVNRNIVGSVVGVQPFGGEGYSGTGPKAGGPHYLTRLCHERTFTVNTAAAGGNATLLALGD